MNTPQSKKRGAPDFLLLMMTLLLVSFGLIMIFSASSSMAAAKEIYRNDLFYFLKRHLIAVGLGFILMIILMNVHYAKFKKLYLLFFFVTLALLALVPLIGNYHNGARRWVFGVQPTEFAKLAIILYLAAIITKKGNKFQNFKSGLLPVLTVVSFFTGCILLQPDYGSGLILLSCAGIMIICGGAKLKQCFFAFGGLAGVIGLRLGLQMFSSSQEHYTSTRIAAFLNPLYDTSGASFQLSRSLQAFGHGGLMGTGLGKSIQKLFYLPYAYNDFIFAVIGEELGFIGTALFILFYLLFIWRVLTVALRCPDKYGMLVGIGLASLIAIQGFINMGGVSGAIPLTGVTLPFISFGGTSILTLLAGMGILLSISREYNRNKIKKPSV